jgi:hypothetical protein
MCTAAVMVAHGVSRCDRHASDGQGRGGGSVVELRVPNELTGAGHAGDGRVGVGCVIFGVSLAWAPSLVHGECGAGVFRLDQ